jgi:hypothetical protein
MKIGGFGELESLRKTVQKDSSKGTSSTPADVSVPVASGETDSVQISPKAQMLGKLRKVPDVRGEEISRVLEKAERGELLTPDAIKESIAKMLENIL